MPVTKCVLLTCNDCEAERLLKGATLASIRPEMERLGWKRRGRTVLCPTCARGAVRIMEQVVPSNKLRQVEKLIPSLDNPAGG